MSLDYWHLSMSTVQLALRNHGFEYRPTGTAEFRFRVGKDWYYINCVKLPCVFISRYVDARSYLGTGFAIGDLFSAMNAVNDKLHLVKASREDEMWLLSLCAYVRTVIWSSRRTSSNTSVSLTTLWSLSEWRLFFSAKKKRKK